MTHPTSISTPFDDRKGSLRVQFASGIGALVLLLGACGASATPHPPVPIPVTTSAASPASGWLASQAPTPAAPATAPPAASASFPVSIKDDEGTQVIINAAPRRIVSLAPSNTEIVFALGAGDRLLAGTDADDYPAEAAALPDVVVKTKILTEQIAALRPDLILAYGNGFNSPGDIGQLRALHYPVVVLYASSVATAEADIALVGKAVGANTQAEAILATIHARFAAITASVPSAAPRPRTFYEVGYGPGIYTPSADSAYAEMIKLAGGQPITTDATFTISLEAVVKADPQVILLGDAAYGVCPDQVRARPGWKTMTAVKAGAVRPVFDTVVTRPGPRLPLGLASLVRGIHPEAKLPAELPPDPALCAAG